jgi:hypothetical protein
MSFRNFWGLEVPPGAAGKEVEVEECDRLNVSQARALPGCLRRRRARLLRCSRVGGAAVGMEQALTRCPAAGRPGHGRQGEGARHRVCD